MANQIGLPPFFTVVVCIGFRCLVNVESIFFATFLLFLLFKRYQLAVTLPVLPKVDHLTVGNDHVSA